MDMEDILFLAEFLSLKLRTVLESGSQNRVLESGSPNRVFESESPNRVL
jgi:hypothetical protein